MWKLYQSLTNKQKRINIKSDSAQIIIEHYPFACQINEKLAQDIVNCGDQQNYSTNAQAPMTNWFFKTDETELIKNWVNSIVRNEYACFKQPLEVKETWGICYGKGNYTEEHDHVPANLSFVYFVKSVKNSSPLIFSASRKKIYPEPGKLIIFPSHLNHYVPKQKTNGERIVLSGNIYTTAFE